jgi:tetratricopeptide (TPR) repeat protein
MIKTAVFSPDGRLVLSADAGGTVSLWNAETGAAAAPPIRCPGEVSYAGFSKDGRRVLTQCNLQPMLNYGGLPSYPLGELRIWETATGQPLTVPLRCRVIGSDFLTFWNGRGNRLFDAGGDSVVCFRADGQLELVDFAAPEGAVAEERAFAEVLSARRVNEVSGVQPLESGPFRDGWRRFEARIRSAERAGVTAADWHRQEAETAGQVKLIEWPQTSRNNADAAEWHLTRLLEAVPGDAAALKLRAQLHAEAARRGDETRWDAAVRDWTAAIGAGAKCWYERGNVYANKRQWREAEADFARAAQESPRRGAALVALALVRLRNGDERGWREACERLRGERDVGGWLVTTSWHKAFTAGPDAVKDWGFVDDLLKRHPKALAPDTPGYAREWVASLLVRAGGRDREALENLPENKGPGNDSLNPAARWFLLALLQHRLNQTVKAKESLANGREALKATDLLPTPMFLSSDLEKWQERVYAELLEREAAGAIEGPKK